MHIRSITSFLSLALASAALFLVGCGDSSGTDGGTDAAADSGHDAGMTDSGMVDLGTDAGTDAGTPDGGPTHSGLISVSDVQVYNHAALGHGGKISISFSPLAGGPTPVAVVDHRSAATGTGCVGVVYHAADLAAASAGVDEGTVSITGTTATIPTCTYVPTRGYLCIGETGTGATTVAVGGPLPAGTALYAVAGATFVAADVGRYLSISGDSVHPLNNGAFPIVGLMGGGLIVGNPAAMTSAYAGTYTTVAGAGPVPGAPPPAFLNESDSVTVALTMGGGMHFPSFTSADIGAIMGVAPFTLLSTGTGVATLDAVPVDGTAFAQGCDMTAGGCGGIVTAIAIDTTDGSTAGLPDYVMPAPTGMVAQVRCADFPSTVTVPADIMALVMMATPTRVQTTVLRNSLAQITDSLNHTNILVGAGWVGFTSAPVVTP